MNIKNLIIMASVAVIVAFGINYAFAEDIPAEPACLAQISKLSDGLKVTELPDAEQASITALKGPPPAEGHFATITAEDEGMFIIHKDDCITFTSGRPVPLDTLNRFLGRVSG